MIVVSNNTYVIFWQTKKNVKSHYFNEYKMLKRQKFQENKLNKIAIFKFLLKI